MQARIPDADRIAAFARPVPLAQPATVTAPAKVLTAHDIAHPDDLARRIEAVEKRDREANKRARDHLFWIIIGLVLTGMLPYFPFAPFIGAMLAGCPMALLEVQNWIHHW